MANFETFSGLKSFTEQLEESAELMPALFMGHGSPMNGIDDNEFSKTWSELGNQLPVPKAVIVISAHWLTKGTGITAMEFPKTIHDFGGFPDHYIPLLYTLGLKGKKEAVSFFNDKAVGGSITMTSVKIG